MPAKKLPPLSSAPDKIPGPGGSPFSWGKQMAKDPLGYTGDLVARYGDIVRLPWVLPTFQVTDPELIGKILMNTEKTNTKSNVYRRLNILLGNGLVTSHGDLWRQQRRLSSPAFHPKVLAGLLVMMQTETDKMLNEWQQQIKSDAVVDISKEMMKLTFRIIVKALFSIDLSEKAEVIRESLHEMQEYARYLFYEVFPLPLFVPTQKNRIAKQAIDAMDAIVYEVINEHKAHPENYQDLLSIYLHARDEDTGKGMSERHLRDEVITLMLAGHDTTAFTLAMALDQVASHPEVQQRLESELAPLDSGAMTLEALKELRYTSMVFSESLRLFPATWAIARELTEALSYKNYEFPKHSTVLLVQYFTHRNPDYWQRAEEFIPERFLPEVQAKQHPFAYFPFGGGQRSCIGSNLAKMEGQIILSSIMRRFHVEPVPGYSYQLVPRITLGAEPGIKLKLRQRVL